MCEPVTCSTNRYGPLPTGLRAKPSSPTCSMYFLGKTMPSVERERERYVGMMRVGSLVTMTTRSGRGRLDGLDERAERSSVAGGGARPDGAHDAELHVLRGEIVAVVELHPLAQIEGPALVIGRVLPARGDAAVLRGLTVEGGAHEIVEHHGKVVLHEMAAEDGIERLRGEARQGHGEIGLALGDRGTRTDPRAQQGEEGYEDSPTRTPHALAPPLGLQGCARAARRHDLTLKRGQTASGPFRRAISEGLPHYTEPVITLARICTTVGSLTFTESRRLRAKRSGVGKPMVMVFTRADWSSTSPKGFCCSSPRLRAAA